MNSTSTFEFPSTRTLAAWAREDLQTCIRRSTDAARCDVVWGWRRITDMNGRAPAFYSFTVDWEWYSADQDRWIDAPVKITIEERDLVRAIQRWTHRTPAHLDRGRCRATADAVDLLISRLVGNAARSGANSSPWKVVDAIRRTPAGGA